MEAVLRAALVASGCSLAWAFGSNMHTRAAERMKYDEDRQLEKARELFDILMDGVFRPRRLFEATDRGACGYIFRGQANREWALVPTVHRDPHAVREYTPQPPPDFDVERWSAKEFLGLCLHAELRAVHLFLEAADRLGIPTPLNYGAMRHHAALINEALDDREPDFAEEFPHSKILPSVALAQHHGVPTRLLDWSESPLVAAFFAAEKASSISCGPRSDTAFAVHCLDTRLVRELPALTMVSAPRHADSFLRSQRGVFILIREANAFFVEHHRWPGIEEVVSRDRVEGRVYFRPPLIRLSLPASEADDLLRLLWQYDITRHHLMPTLHSAARAFSSARALWPQ